MKRVTQAKGNVRATLHQNNNYEQHCMIKPQNHSNSSQLAGNSQQLRRYAIGQTVNERANCSYSLFLFSIFNHLYPPSTFHAKPHQQHLTNLPYNFLQPQSLRPTFQFHKLIMLPSACFPPYTHPITSTKNYTKNT